MKNNAIFRLATAAALWLGIFLWLWLACPQYLTYQEQNQLFLFSRTFFEQTCAVPGGFADWLSEFIVQFDYVPLYGAALTALLLTLTQVFLSMALRRGPLADCACILAAVAPLLFVGAMADENTLLSFGAAMMLAALWIWAFSLPWQLRPWLQTAVYFTAASTLYLLAGPIAFVFIVGAGIMRRSWNDMGSLIVLYFIWARWPTGGIELQQYPMERLLLGINYYRIPEVYPTVYFAIAALMGAVCGLSLAKREHTGINGKSGPALQKSSFFYNLSSILMVVGAIVWVPMQYDREKSSLLAYDSLVRQGRWNDILLIAKEEPPTSAFAQQAVNLALGMTGQLPESMFRFPQSGQEGLIGRAKLDNTSQLITAEALFRLGLTNIAFATTFDLQESIMNDRKSGRHMKRLAECAIINGNYAVAEKYIGMLAKTLFYSDWARRAHTLLNRDEAVAAHPVYGEMRRNRFKQEAFFDIGQLDKILAMLAMQSGGSNRLAWQYFLASAMLNGDLATLAGVWNSSAPQFEPDNIPRHVQEALALYWSMGHGNFEGIPFRISPEVMEQTARLARASMQPHAGPAAWEAAAPASYGVYFLKNAARSQTAEAAGYSSTHE